MIEDRDLVVHAGPVEACKDQDAQGHQVGAVDIEDPGQGADPSQKPGQGIGAVKEHGLVLAAPPGPAQDACHKEVIRGGEADPVIKEEARCDGGRQGGVDHKLYIVFFLALHE